MMGLEDSKNDEISADSYELPNNVKEAIPNPLVSVHTLAYQQVPYIKQCLDSLLAQKTNFGVEYIIGEDFSTDGTREIVMEYAKKFPDKIRVITSDHNVGMEKNEKRCAYAVRGKYIAFCEGDDSWTDPYKLQKQVEILEKNEEYGLVYTDCSVYIQETGLVIPSYREAIAKNISSGDVFLNLLEGNFLATVTVMVKSCIYLRSSESLNSWLSKDLKIDYASWLEISRSTKFYYMEEVTSQYRVSKGTVSNPDDDYKKTLFSRKIFYIVKEFCNKYEVDSRVFSKYREDFFKSYLNNIFRIKDYYRFDQEISGYIPNSKKDKLLLFLFKNSFPRFFFILLETPWWAKRKANRIINKFQQGS